MTPHSYPERDLPVDLRSAKVAPKKLTPAQRELVRWLAREALKSWQP